MKEKHQFIFNFFISDKNQIDSWDLVGNSQKNFDIKINNILQKISSIRKQAYLFFSGLSRVVLNVNKTTLLLKDGTYF